MTRQLLGAHSSHLLQTLLHTLLLLNAALFLSHLLRINPILTLSQTLSRWGRRAPPPVRTLRFPEALLKSRCEHLLRANGLDAAASAVVADALVAAQRDGKTAHGLGRLPAIVRSIRNGDVDGSARPLLTSVAPGMLRVDAQEGLVQPALAVGLPALAARAKELGVCVLAVIECRGIIGSLWGPLELLAQEHQLVGLACCNSPPFLTAAGGTSRVFGTNPLAFAWPRADGRPPVVIDMASARMSRGDMELAARLREPLPLDAALDPQGQPTTDAELGLAGTQLPFGGHKGAAIALAVELLGSALLGTDLAIDCGDRSERMNRGVFLMAIDPARLSKLSLECAERLFARMQQDPEVRLPADSRYKKRADAEANGVEVDAALVEECFGPEFGPNSV